MKKVINHLIQLQELMEARAQQESSGQTTRLTQLNDSIKSMLKELPDDLQVKFEKIRKKSHVAIAPVHNSACSACGMALPVSVVQMIKAQDQITQCPACARILFFPVGSLPKHVGQRGKRRLEPVKVGIARFSAQSLMTVSLKAPTRDEVLAAMCCKMNEAGFIDDAEKLIEAVLRREAIASTVVDHGLAFPHVRGVEGGGLTMACGIHKKGVRFDDTSRYLTRIIFLMVIPTAASAFYLKLVAGLSQAFLSADSRKKLLECKTDAEMWKTLERLTRKTVL